MKNKIISIAILLIIMLMAFSVNVNAASFNISTNEKQIKSGNEVIVNINTDANMETATFYIKYDNMKLDFVETKSTNVNVKDYPEEGTLRVVYLDMALKGTDELRFKFKAKDNAKENAEFSITNLTVQFVNDSNIYTDSNLKDSKLNVSIDIQQSLITNGIIIALIAVAVLLILLVIVSHWGRAFLA